MEAGAATGPREDAESATTSWPEWHVGEKARDTCYPPTVTRAVGARLLLCGLTSCPPALIPVLWKAIPGPLEVTPHQPREGEAHQPPASALVSD